MVKIDDLATTPFASCDEQAKEYFQKFEHLDPFAREIPAALLNSRDISDYVRVTGMMYPFNIAKKGKLKSASYEVDFIGDVYYWEDGDKEVFTRTTITIDEPFTIPKNSIVFVSPATTFRLPDYIALRFNLRIKHVHRGLLLGTGPLVDPGFAGRLFIPLHNLTSQPYTILGGEGLIWVEFTKVSPHPHWTGNPDHENGYEHFPKDNRYLSPQRYLDKAKLDSPARSSIPLEIEEAVSVSTNAMATASRTEEKIQEEISKMTQDIAIAASRAEQKIEEVRSKMTRNITIAGVVAAIGVILPIYGLIQDATQYIRESSMRDLRLEKAMEAQGAVISDLSKKIAQLETETGRFAEQGTLESLSADK